MNQLEGGGSKNKITDLSKAGKEMQEGKGENKAVEIPEWGFQNQRTVPPECRTVNLRQIQGGQLSNLLLEELERQKGTRLCKIIHLASLNEPERTRRLAEMLNEDEEGKVLARDLTSGSGTEAASSQQKEGHVSTSTAESSLHQPAATVAPDPTTVPPNPEQHFQEPAEWPKVESAPEVQSLNEVKAEEHNPDEQNAGRVEQATAEGADQGSEQADFTE